MIYIEANKKPEFHRKEAPGCTDSCKVNNYQQKEEMEVPGADLVVLPLLTCL